MKERTSPLHGLSLHHTCREQGLKKQRKLKGWSNWGIVVVGVVCIRKFERGEWEALLARSSNQC